jgi:hypothetical protein
MPDRPVLVDLNGLRLSLLIDPESFASTLEERVKAEGGGAFDLAYATQVSRNTEAVLLAVGWVRRHAMLEENLLLGNGAEVARRAGVQRGRAHTMMNRATHERIHGVTLRRLLALYPEGA